MSKDKIIYRVDGGRVWGVSMGHVKRAMISAMHLANLYEVVFIMKDYKDGISYVKDSGFAVETIGINDDRDETIVELIKKHDPIKVIFDLRSNPYNSLFDFARDNNIKTIVFDILGDCGGSPDIIINDSFVPEFTSYSLESKKTSLYIGPEYFLSEGLPSPEELNEKITNVAVTMGGSDPAGLTKKIVEILIESSENKQYNIILGPLFCDISEQYIREICRGKKNFIIYKNPTNFLGILALQDLVICAAGRTLYECAYLGRPTIVVPSIEHERVTAVKYSELTKSHNVGLWQDDTPLKIKKSISRYENFQLREELHFLGRSLIDGNANDRIMKLLN